jgi:hypothetical protein
VLQAASLPPPSLPPDALPPPPLLRTGLLRTRLLRRAELLQLVCVEGAAWYVAPDPQAQSELIFKRLPRCSKRGGRFLCAWRIFLTSSLVFQKV